MNAHDEVGQDLQPILDLFSGADGGVGFAQLRHSFLPNIYAKANKDENELACMEMVKRFSRLCEVMLRPTT